MEKQYTILLGPVESDKVGAALAAVCDLAPLIEVTLMESKTESEKTPIVRHRVTEDDKREMISMSEANYPIKAIAEKIGCAPITVMRHVPKFQKGYKL